jgi:hypothetical protein
MAENVWQPIGTWNPDTYEGELVGVRPKAGGWWSPIASSLTPKFIASYDITHWCPEPSMPHDPMTEPGWWPVEQLRNGHPEAVIFADADHRVLDDGWPRTETYRGSDDGLERAFFCVVSTLPSLIPRPEDGE